MTPHDEPARDAWLSQALRHAPDAEAAPPAEVSEAILRQARDAVKPPRAAAAPRANPLLQLWSWLARPPVAAGFATLTVATLVGVMWWDRPLDASLPQPEAPAASTVAPAPKEDKAVARAEPEQPRTATRPPPTAIKRERAAPAPAPAAAPAVIADSAAQAREEAETDERRRAPAAAPAQALAKAAAPRESTAGRLSLRQQDADTMTPTIDQPERWTWQRGAGPQPMTPALQAWLAQLERVAHWRPAGEAAPAAAEGKALQLRRDGALHTTIVLGDDAIWLRPAAGAPVTAPLSAAAAATLAATLIEAAP